MESLMNPGATIDVVVRDGSTVSLRGSDERDLDGVVEFLERLSPRSRYFRFFGYPSLTPERVRPLVAAGAGTGSALVAESGGRVVGFAGYHRNPHASDRAEVAFAVADALQGNGIGTRLLEQLARLAREEGIERFDAFVLAGNRRNRAGK